MTLRVIILVDVIVGFKIWNEKQLCYELPYLSWHDLDPELHMVHILQQPLVEWVIDYVDYNDYSTNIIHNTVLVQYDKLLLAYVPLLYVVLYNIKV